MQIIYSIQKPLVFPEMTVYGVIFDEKVKVFSVDNPVEIVYNYLHTMKEIMIIVDNCPS